MIIIDIMLNCNTLTGVFDEQITSARIQKDDKLIEFCGYPLTAYQILTNDGRELLHIEDLDEEDSIIRLPYQSRKIGSPNNYWNRYQVEISNCLRLVEYLRGCWRCTCPENFAKEFDNGESITESYLIETLNLVSPV